MKLVRARVQNYKNILDTGEFTLGYVTCLVGKNQSGKSALLQALYRLNPVDDRLYRFDHVRDYPKSSVVAFTRRQVTGDASEYVVSAVFELDESDRLEIYNLLGTGSLPSDLIELTVHVDYNNNLFIDELPFDEDVVLDHFIDEFE